MRYHNLFLVATGGADLRRVSAEASSEIPKSLTWGLFF